jgi:outer membrane murein-binding lipoprotein Lpp
MAAVSVQRLAGGVAAAAIAVLVVSGCSGPTESDEYKALASELAESQAATEAAVKETDEVWATLSAELQATYSAREDQLDSKYQTLRDRLDQREQSLEKHARQRTAQMDARDRGLDGRARDLDARERDIIVLEDEQAANQFGGGTVIVGRDITPGQYQSAGGGGCYWEFLSGTGSDAEIIDNHYGPGQQYATLADGQVFKSNGCGTWNRVG